MDDYAGDRDTDWKSFVEEHRDRLERKADGDSPTSWVCQRILNWYDGRFGE